MWKIKEFKNRNDMNNFINKNKNEMLMAEILYNMSCHYIYEELTEEEKEKLLDFTYRFYMKDESCIDLGKITDTVMKHKNEIIAGEIDRYNLYDYINY